MIRTHIDGLLAWWALAGVDEATGEAEVNWLRPPARPAPSPSPAVSPYNAPYPSSGSMEGRAITESSGAMPVAEAASRPHSPPHSPTATDIPQPALAEETAFPRTLNAFHDYLARSDALPEARWPGRRIMPHMPGGAGPATPPELMIILAAPDTPAPAHQKDASQDGAESLPLRPEAMRLLMNMLRCIGLSGDDCAIATLSLIAPPGGMIDSDLLAPLAKRMRHHVSLVAPKALLLLGDQAKRALLPANNGPEAESLLFVNQAGGTVPTAAILHPRLMLEQPSAKAEAWKALRAFIRNREH